MLPKKTQALQLACFVFQDAIGSRISVLDLLEKLHIPIGRWQTSFTKKSWFFGSQWHWLQMMSKCFWWTKIKPSRIALFVIFHWFFCLRIVGLHPLHLLYIQFPLLIPPDVLVLHGQHRCRTFPKRIHQAHWEGMPGFDQNCMASISMRWWCLSQTDGFFTGSC